MNQSLQAGPTVSTKLGVWQVMTVTPGMAFDGNLLRPKQVHGGNIVAAEELRRGEIAADGVVVSDAGTMGAVVTADCMPLVLVSEVKALALHVSRKSIVNGLMDNVLTHLDPTEIDHVYIGPHVCNYHFSFEDEGAELRRFRVRWPEAVHFHKGMLHVSLRKALQGFLTAWQVHPDKVEMDGRCTFETAELPSYRRKLKEGREGQLGQLMTVVWQGM